METIVPTTNSNCFLCLKEVKGGGRYCKEEKWERIKNDSFRSAFRYLKLKEKDVKVRVCTGKCFSLVEKFKELYQWYETIQMKLDSCLETLLEVMEESNQEKNKKGPLPQICKLEKYRKRFMEKGVLKRDLGRRQQPFIGVQKLPGFDSTQTAGRTAWIIAEAPSSSCDPNSDFQIQSETFSIEDKVKTENCEGGFSGENQKETTTDLFLQTAGTLKAETEAASSKPPNSEPAPKVRSNPKGRPKGNGGNPQRKNKKVGPLFLKFTEVTSEGLFKCKLCENDKVYDKKGNLYMHCRRVHSKELNLRPDDNVRFQCDVPNCPRVYNNKESLAKHKWRFHRRHGNQPATLPPPKRPYQLVKPGTEHIQIQDLNEDQLLARHTFTEEPPDKFRCNDCGKLFNTKYDQRSHYISKHTNFRFKCLNCNCLLFKYLKSLRAHQIKCYGDRPPRDKSVCEICGKEFSNSKSFQTHFKAIHLHIRDFQCSECGKSFGGSSDLRQHKRRVHSNPRRKKRSGKWKKTEAEPEIESVEMVHLQKMEAE